MKKRVVSILLSAVMAVMLLGGCEGLSFGSSGAKAEDKTDQQNDKKLKDWEESLQAESKQQLENQDGEDSAASKSDEDTIHYVSMWSENETQAKVLKEAAEAYKAETGVTVDIEFDGRSKIREGLSARLQDGEDIDLFDEDMSRAAALWGDYMLDLSDYLERDYKGKPYIDYIDKDYTGIYDAVQELSGGQGYKGIPYQPYIVDIVYNKTIFAAAGISGVPATWDEFTDACQRIKNAGFVPITTDDVYIDCMLGYTMAAYVGAERVGEIVKSGEWTDTAVLQSAQTWQQLAASGFLSPNIGTNVYPNGQNGEFAAGQAAMYINGTWMAKEISAIKDPAMETGIFAFPSIEGAQNGNEAANFGAQIFAVNKNSQKADTAFDFIAFVTTGEWDQKLADETLGLPMDAAGTCPKEQEDAKALFPTLTTRYPWAGGVENNEDNMMDIRTDFTELLAGTKNAEEFVASLPEARQN